MGEIAISICEYCNGEVALPFTCRRCKKLFCPEHKLPETHDCELLKKVRESRNIEKKKDVSCTNCDGTGWVKVTSHIKKRVEYRKCPRCTENWIPEPDKPDDALTRGERYEKWLKKHPYKNRPFLNISRKITFLTKKILVTISKMILLFIIVLIMVPSLRYPFVTLVFSTFPPDELTIEKAVFELTNEERQRVGLHPLSYNEDLHIIAKEHSKDMIERNYTSHYTPEGLSLTKRAEMKNIVFFTNLGENIIGTRLGIYEKVRFQNPEDGYTTPIEWSCSLVLTSKQIAKCAVEGWKDSPGHYKNIIYPDYEEIGVGVYCRYDRCKITQNFGAGIINVAKNPEN